MSNTKKTPFREKHAYGAIVGGLNFEVKNDQRNIAEQLNYIKDNLEKFLSDERSIHRLISEDSTVLNEKHGLQAAATVWFTRWFLGNFRVRTFINTLEGNPDGNRTGKELYREYIRKDSKISEIEPKPYDQERLLLFDEALKNGEIVGGISFFKIFQHTYSLTKELQKKFGDIAIHVSHAEKFAESEGESNPTKAEKMVVAVAQEMHKRKRAKKASEQTETDQSEKSETIVEDITQEFVEAQTSAEDILEMLETKELKTTDLESVEKMEEIYEMASGGIKSALTRRMKQL